MLFFIILFCGLLYRPHNRSNGSSIKNLPWSSLFSLPSKLKMTVRETGTGVTSLYQSVKKLFSFISGVK